MNKLQEGKFPDKPRFSLEVSGKLLAGQARDTSDCEDCVEEVGQSVEDLVDFDRMASTIGGVHGTNTLDANDKACALGANGDIYHRGDGKRERRKDDRRNNTLARVIGHLDHDLPDSPEGHDSIICFECIIE